MSPTPEPTSSTRPSGESPPPDAGVYVDWGPALPEAFGSGRARLMVVNPTTLHLSWEPAAGSALAGASAWVVEVRGDGDGLLSSWRVDADGRKSAYTCWMTVQPRTAGTVRLLGELDGQLRRVADLAFATPSAAPSDDLAERWGALDRLDGHVQEAAAVSGQRVEVAGTGPSPSSSTRPRS
jgi:hypothetical protein